MKRTMFTAAVLATIIFVQPALYAFDFGTIDAAKVFSNYSETIKTKNHLEGEKVKLQKELDEKTQTLKKLDDQYLSVAKRIQDFRLSKKEKEAQALEGTLAKLREEISKKNSETKEFFETSQKALYELENNKMNDLSKKLDTNVEKVVAQLARKYKLKAVLEKRNFYWSDKDAVKDLTDEVLANINK